jgi:hypothetical protein
MTITINLTIVVTTLVAFFFGMLFALALDVMATPTAEELAADKADKEMEMMEMEMFMKVMGACPTK